jgi:hypothetical protein
MDVETSSRLSDPSPISVIVRWMPLLPDGSRNSPKSVNVARLRNACFWLRESGPPGIDNFDQLRVVGLTVAAKKVDHLCLIKTKAVQCRSAPLYSLSGWYSF